MLIKGPDMDGNGDSSSDLYNFFTNESSNRKEFRWIKKEIEVTSPRWQFSVCDDNACWFAPIDSADVVVNGNTES